MRRCWPLLALALAGCDGLRAPSAALEVARVTGRVQRIRNEALAVFLVWRTPFDVEVLPGASTRVEADGSFEIVLTQAPPEVTFVRANELDPSWPEQARVAQGFFIVVPVEADVPLAFDFIFEPAALFERRPVLFWRGPPGNEGAGPGIRVGRSLSGPFELARNVLLEEPLFDEPELSFRYRSQLLFESPLASTLPWNEPLPDDLALLANQPFEALACGSMGQTYVFVDCSSVMLGLCQLRQGKDAVTAFTMALVGDPDPGFLQDWPCNPSLEPCRDEGDAFVFLEELFLCAEGRWVREDDL
ncbi:MAG: hypothetical protein AAGD10_21670 [Myxococcota bacterium]